MSTTTSSAGIRSARGRSKGRAGRAVLAALPTPTGGGYLAATPHLHPYRRWPGATQCSDCWGFADDPRHSNQRFG